MMPLTLPLSTPTAPVDSGFETTTLLVDEQQEQDRELQGSVQGCVHPQSLQTPFEADTVVFGTMYTVLSHADPISVLTMEISANPIATTMAVEVYTKLGDYKGAEADSEQWTNIVDTSLTPAREGRGTIIPPSEFASFIMNPNELRAFFVSLKSSDLRYNRAEGLGEGEPFVADGYLSINVGIGVAGYGFGNQIFPERMFSGIIHYSHVTSCDTPSSKTLVTYSFHVRPKGGAASRADIIEELNKRVRQAVEETIGTEMADLRDKHAIFFESISTVTSNLEKGKCPVDGWSNCVLLDSKVTLSHLNTVTNGQLEYLLLYHGKDVAKHVKEDTIQAKYAGHDTLEKVVNIALQGVPYGVPMSNEQILFVELTTTEYLEEKTVGLTSAKIIGTKITRQRGPDFMQGQLRNLEGGSSSEGWIELSVNVLALLVPPLLASDDLLGVVNGAFRGGSDEFVQDLRAARHRPGSPVKGEAADYFVKITQVRVSNPSDDSPNWGGRDPTATSMDGQSTNKILGMTTSAFISVCAFGLLGTLAWLWYAFCRNRSDVERGPEIAFVDSNGQRRRRSSVFFGGGGKQSKSGRKGTKVGQVATKEEKGYSRQSKEVLSSSSTSKSWSKSREKEDGSQTKSTSGERGALSSSTRSKNARNGMKETREIETLYNSSTSSSKSTQAMNERSSSKKVSNRSGRSPERNKAQTERIMRSSAQSNSKSPKSSSRYNLSKDESTSSNGSRGMNDSPVEFSKRSTKPTSIHAPSSNSTRERTRSSADNDKSESRSQAVASLPPRSSSPRMTNKDERTRVPSAPSAKSERITTAASIRAKRGKAQSTSKKAAAAADVPTTGARSSNSTSRSSEHSRLKTTKTTIIGDDDKSIGLD